MGEEAAAREGADGVAAVGWVREQAAVKEGAESVAAVA